MGHDGCGGVESCGGCCCVSWWGGLEGCSEVFWYEAVGEGCGYSLCRNVHCVAAGVGVIEERADNPELLDGLREFSILRGLEAGITLDPCFCNS